MNNDTEEYKVTIVTVNQDGNRLLSPFFVEIKKECLKSLKKIKVSQLEEAIKEYGNFRYVEVIEFINTKDIILRW